MSSTFAEALSNTISSGDSATTVALLEPRIAEGAATDGEKLLCGVMLLLPPLADYEAASRIFLSTLNGVRRFEAAVWDAYRYALLAPDGNRPFEEVLRSSTESSVAAHMMSLVSAAVGNPASALSENERSRALRMFPFNIAEALRHETALSASARRELWKMLGELVISRSAERDPPVQTTEGWLQRRWDNLILGTRLTSPLWSEYERMFGN